MANPTKKKPSKKRGASKSSPRTPTASTSGIPGQPASPFFPVFNTPAKRQKTTTAAGGPTTPINIPPDLTLRQQPNTTTPTPDKLYPLFTPPPANPIPPFPTVDEFIQNISDSRLHFGDATSCQFREERVQRIHATVTAPPPGPITQFHVDGQPRVSNAQAGECVLYWMSRDARVQDNWAFIYAQRAALRAQVPLLVVYCLVPTFADATLRAYKFLLGGLREVRQECDQLDIPFHLLLGQAVDILPDFILTHQVTTLVCDFSPLKMPTMWVEQLKDRIGGIPFFRVDAHNIIPCWIASRAEEPAAATFRARVQGRINLYLQSFPPIIQHPFKATTSAPQIDWKVGEDSLQVDRKVDAVQWATPGLTGGYVVVHEFLTKRLKKYEKRNDPNANAQSQLSPWLKFGQLSAARVVMEARAYAQTRPTVKTAYEQFFEEIVIRRELSDNFCHYNKYYDRIEGAPQWAQATLNAHAGDPRPIIYSRKELEEGRTADDLWNACQWQLNVEGKLSGYLRMYWAKKLLEWTPTAQEALQISIYLNDKYSLDGRDPNGYVGCLWSICGLHDEAFAERIGTERPVFGKIRYMNYQGCVNKFKVREFVARYQRFFPKPVAVNYGKKY